MQIEITREALEIMTPEQKAAILYLTRDEARVEVTKLSPFDLPEGWLTFVQRYAAGGSVYGGIAPDGAVST